MINQPVLWDVDFDFFLDSECTILEDRDKTYWLSPDILLEKHRMIPRTPVVNHRECLRRWDEVAMQGWLCIHFDAHPDLFDDVDPGLGNMPLGWRGDLVTDGNYLLVALREGIFSQIVWVLPDWQNKSHYRAEFDRCNPELSHRVKMLRYSEFLVSECAQCFPVHIDGAFSPNFTPLSKLPDFVELFDVDENLTDIIAEACLAVQFRRPSRESHGFLARTDAAIVNRNVTLYHGTSVDGLETLIPEPHGLVFGSPSPGFAACFALDIGNKEGWVHGVEYLTGPRPFVYLLVPSEHESRLDNPLHLYRIMGSMGQFKPAGEVVNFEFASGAPVQVTGHEYFERAYDALEKYGVRVLIGARQRIQDPCLVELARTHCRAVEAFFQMDLPHILALPFFAPLLQLFFVARGIPIQDVPSTVGHSDTWFRWIDRELAPRAFTYSQQAQGGYHGFEHNVFVARVSALFAVKRSCNPLPVVIGGLLHDAGRCDDSHGPDHAILGADIASIVLHPWLGYCLSHDVQSSVVEAIRTHPAEQSTGGPLAACLRDADRLRLSWEHGFESKYFLTSDGAESASRSPFYVKNQLESLASDESLELKFEVTEQCNLACSFCHQDFGRAAGVQVLDRSIYQRILVQAHDEGINALRLTGGEPMILKSIGWYLEQAKKFGFHVTVNSNGTALTESRIKAFKGFVDCFKISLPAADEQAMTRITGDRRAWLRKWESIAYLAGYGYDLEILSVMTRENIERFDDFIDLLAPLNVRWVPLRAEPQEGDKRPVSREDVIALANHLTVARRRERWGDLTLGLAVPFCALDNPFEAARLFSGGRGCGPVQSLTITSTGQVSRCYSRREPVQITRGLREACRTLLREDLAKLPPVCQDCGFWFECRGGCRCDIALENTSLGLLDYLANPRGLSERLAQAVSTFI
ncbi:MAG: radical SAM protein [Betaproteobacteria bacterium]